MGNHEKKVNHKYTLPDGYSIQRLQNLPFNQQENYMPSVFDLIKEHYPEWYPLEKQENWLKALNGGNKNGTKMAVSAVLNDQNQVVGASAMELYKNGTAIINFSIGYKKDHDYQNVVYYATKDMADAIKCMQTLSVAINFVCKEHHLYSARAHTGYFAIGQVPIDGPTSLVKGKIKYYEVAYGNPQDLHDPDKLKAAMALADPKTPPVAEVADEDVHLWLIRDFIPSLPNLPLAGSLKDFADAYAKEHSIFRDKDICIDPAWIALHKLAASIPTTATYREAVQASWIGAAAYMGLPANGIPDEHGKLT